jgi:D-xylose 1-dehydrogenase (NADP+, D-xylono-1,5-lactone-forming)
LTTTVKWGIMSTANINKALIPGAHASSKLQLVAVASRDRARAEAYASQWEIPRAYGRYEDMIEDPEIEAVYISLPNNLHCEWATKAVRGGKHVLCEKPLTRRVADAEAVFEAAEGGRRLVSEAFMYRHNPQTKRFAGLVAEGAIGELRLVRASFSYSLYDKTNIRLRADVEGGALMDVGCYCVNASRMLAGEPESVAAHAWYGPTGTDWVSTATMKFPGNTLALFDCGTALPRRNELEAIGSEGSLFVDDPWFCRKPVIELRRNGEIERIRMEPEDSYRLELENLSDAIRGEVDLLLGRDDALGQARALQALHRSATGEDAGDQDIARLPSGPK